MEGWIKLHRRLIQWEWFSTPNMVHVFIYLLLSANHKEGEWQGKTIKRGQLITGLNKLKADTGISVRSLRTCLKRLKSTGEVTIQPTNKFSIITLCNYDSYQALNNDGDIQNDTQADKPATSKRQANDNKQEELRRIKKEKKEDANFYFSEEELKNAMPEVGYAEPDTPEKLKEIEDFKKMLMENY